MYTDGQEDVCGSGKDECPHDPTCREVTTPCDADCAKIHRIVGEGCPYVAEAILQCALGEGACGEPAPLMPSGTSSTDPNCSIDDLLLNIQIVGPEDAVLESGCQQTTTVQSGHMCSFSKPGHVCSSSSCLVGAWSQVNCVQVINKGCKFSSLQLSGTATGAQGDGHENCHGGAASAVPHGSSCTLSKQGHLCTATRCMPDGSWSIPLCVAHAEPLCNLAGLKIPTGARLITEKCQHQTSGKNTALKNGEECGFEKDGHVCSVASCVAGTWSNAQCRPQQKPPEESGCISDPKEIKKLRDWFQDNRESKFEDQL